MDRPTQVAGFDPIMSGRFWLIGDKQQLAGIALALVGAVLLAAQA